MKSYLAQQRANLDAYLFYTDPKQPTIFFFANSSWADFAREHPDQVDAVTKILFQNTWPTKN